MSASSSAQTEKVGPEFQEVPVWKIRWVPTSFKQIQNQGNFPVKMLAVPPQGFFPPSNKVQHIKINIKGKVLVFNNRIFSKMTP